MNRNCVSKPKPSYGAWAPSITLTGPDERTNLATLAEIEAEIRFLYTTTPEGRNRYPRLEWIMEAIYAVPRVAIHICGTGARKELIEGSLDALIPFVGRIQVNGWMSVEEAEFICASYPNTQIITQHFPGNYPLLEVNAVNHCVLVDASGGRGRLPEKWESPNTSKAVGFAGGLGPDNLATQLPLIESVAQEGWWIDMEGNLRDGDWFSNSRALRCQRIFADHFHSGEVAC
jgi:hypothetical protein